MQRSCRYFELILLCPSSCRLQDFLTALFVHLQRNEPLQCLAVVYVNSDVSFCCQNTKINTDLFLISGTHYLITPNGTRSSCSTSYPHSSDRQRRFSGRHRQKQHRNVKQRHCVTLFHTGGTSVHQTSTRTAINKCVSYHIRVRNVDFIDKTYRTKELDYVQKKLYGVVAVTLKWPWKDAACYLVWYRNVSSYATINISLVEQWEET